MSSLTYTPVLPGPHDPDLLGHIAALEQAYADVRAENAHLKTLLVTDELTGLANRQGFRAAFLAEQDRLKRARSSGAVAIMIDLDRFKAINDTLGHAAGDQALCTIAQALRTHTRAMDTPARLAGDEFAVLLVDVQPHTALDRAQHLSLALNRLTFEWDGQGVRLGASLGVRAMNTVDSCDTLLAKADLLMYAHKRRHAAPVPPKGLKAVLQGEEGPEQDGADAIIGGLTSLRILDYMQDPNPRTPQ